MTLLDIGNTTVSVWNNGVVDSILLRDFSWDEFNECYYICVNDALKPQNKPDSRINLESYFRLNTAYCGLGVDRVASCFYVDNGVIVDAGSAITVDKMSAGKHLGGYILPGLQAFLRSYSTISPRLEVMLNTQTDLQVLPNNTKDAISYGIISSITSSIERFSQNETIYLTGGDSSFLVRFLPRALVQQNLVFKGMLKLIRQQNL